MSTVVPWDFTDRAALREGCLTRIMALCDLDPWVNAAAHRLRDTLPVASDLPTEKWRELAELAEHAQFYAETGQLHLAQSMIAQMRGVLR